MLDGKDLKQLNVKWLRQQIGLVGQVSIIHSPRTVAIIDMTQAKAALFLAPGTVSFRL
jgi:ABC-type multidrug transport system fused ATPase/permease subunit